MTIRFSEPKDTDTMHWTRHCKEKMKFYRLSASMVKNVFWNSVRTEEGIVEGTSARMRPSGSAKRPQEIWIMYQPCRTGAVRIISAWRYPGVTKSKDPIPVPPDIMEELQVFGKKLV